MAREFLRPILNQNGTRCRRTGMQSISGSTQVEQETRNGIAEWITSSFSLIQLNTSGLRTRSFKIANTSGAN